MVSQDGTKLEYRECVVSNLKTPTRRAAGEAGDVEFVSQARSVWHLHVQVKKILATPLKTAKGVPVVQYVLQDADGSQWLVYSRNKADSNQSFTPMGKSKGLHFQPGEIVCETAWQQLEEGERPLMAIRTNQVGKRCRREV